jgi:replication factor A1
MPTKRIIDQILLKHPEISSEKLLEKLGKERKKMGGLISDETLLRILAAELGVEIANNEMFAPNLVIGDLIPSLNDISVTGRVVAVFSPKTFEGKRSGKLASLFIADRSGMLRVVLWNSKVSFVESNKLKVGQITRFLHGYTREDRSGKVELHIGEKGSVEIDPSDFDAKDFVVQIPNVKIDGITSANKSKRLNVVGTVKELFAPSDFQRQDASSGRVMRFVLADETGEITVVVWNEKVDEIESMLEKGARLQIVQARVKRALGDKIEIHVDAGTYVGTAEDEESFLTIAELSEGLSHVNVKGEVATKSRLREVKTSKGEVVKLAVFELKDASGRIWVSAWRQHADTVKDLEVGDKVVLRDVSMRKGFGDQLEVSTRASTSITLLS